MTNLKDDSFGLNIPRDIVVPLASKLGYKWSTLSRTFEFPTQGSADKMTKWYAQFNEIDREKISEVVKLICQPKLVSDIMQVEDDIIAKYRVLLGSEGGPVLLISEVGTEMYSCSLKKDKYVLYEELFPVIKTENPYWETPFSFQLSRREFFVLHSIIDLEQRYRYSALLDQRPYDRKLRISDLERVMKMSESQPDWRWIAPFMNSTIPRLGEIPKGKALIASLIELAKEGFIFMDDDQTQIALSESGRFYAKSISRRYSALNINRVSYDTAGNHVGEGTIFISSDQFLWTMDIGWLSDDKVVVSSIDANLVEEIIDDMMSPTGSPAMADMPKVKAVEQETFPDTVVEQSGLDETWIMHKEDTVKIPVSGKTAFCRECGKEIASDSKFCKYCGTKRG